MDTVTESKKQLLEILISSKVREVLPMAVSHKGAISFRLVHIPIALYTATQDNDIRFNQLCKEDHSRIRYKKTCASCGKEITSADIVKGFEYADGQYVIVEDDDFEKIKTPKDKTISILHFTDLQSIPPIFYDKTYHVVPEKAGRKRMIFFAVP